LSKYSLQARSSSLQGWGLINLPLHVFFQFPMTFSRVAWSILDCAQRLPLFVSWKDTPVGLRAAVERGPSQGARVPGAQDQQGCPSIPLSCAWREQRRPTDHPSNPFHPPHCAPKGSGLGCPLLRASSDHCFIVGALRARRAPGHSPSILPLTDTPHPGYDLPHLIRP
jgi:hypothetical protein